MTERKRRARHRGGASCPCPKCGAASKVLDTRRLPWAPVGATERQRRCSRGHRFRTVEEARP